MVPSETLIYISKLIIDIKYDILIIFHSYILIDFCELFV